MHHQLLCITYDIYQSLDDGLETRAVFLDISKAFDKVWHEGLLFKLKQNGISGNLLNVITDFLYQRKQRVVLNGQHSSWTIVQVGDPPGIYSWTIVLSDLYQFVEGKTPFVVRIFLTSSSGYFSRNSAAINLLC